MLSFVHLGMNLFLLGYFLISWYFWINSCYFFYLDVVIVCRVDSIVTDIEFTIEWLQEKKRFKNVFFYWQCSLILGVATLVIFILLGFGPVDYYVTARPLITKSCVVGNCRKKGTQCFRLKAAAVTAWTFLLTLLLRALSNVDLIVQHCSTLFKSN